MHECRKEIIDSNFKGVFGSPSFGFHEKNLDSLIGLSALETIWFWDVELDDINAVYGFTSLKYFGIHPKRPAVDFVRLPNLEKLIWEYKSTDANLIKLDKLDLLHIWRYAPKDKTFGSLQLPENLNELQLLWANPKSLDGLKCMSTVRRLEIHRCRNLESLALIPDLFPNLEHLVITACGRVSSAEGQLIIGRLPFLKHAFVQDKKIV